MTEKIKASKSNFASDDFNLSEILDVAEEIKKRFSNILSQITERLVSFFSTTNMTNSINLNIFFRQVLLGDIQHSLDLYEKAYKTETKWINTLKSSKEQNQIIHKLNENISQQQTNMQDDITELKKTFDPVAVS